MKRSSQLKREGQFTVTTTGENHCGTKDVLTIRYRLVASCPDSALDYRGFLFDQTKVHDWFQDIRTTALSCEDLARFCARELYKLIVRENGAAAPTAMTLALSPEPYAAEIEWQWDGSLFDVEGLQAVPGRAKLRTGPTTLKGVQQGLGLEGGSLFA